MTNSRTKITKGQFFTKENLWLQPQVLDFIKSSGCSVAYDPFAGNGDLLRCHREYGISFCTGKDIDGRLGWEVNDSLKFIPPVKDAILITNPPYLSNYSASRKKVMEDVKQYFDSSRYDDLYLIALDRMLEAQEYVVALVPETFINSGYCSKNRLHSITILEDNPFEDTDTPICVVCFDGKEKSFSEICVYKNNTFVAFLSELESLRPKTNNMVPIRFNELDGWLGLRAVDTTNPEKMLKFDFKENFDYDWDKGIKVSSRLLSVIDIDVRKEDRQEYIHVCNGILSDLREKTQDIILSPFKGNMKNGVRRRRLDYYTARAIMEKAYQHFYGGNESYEQLGLF